MVRPSGAEIVFESEKKTSRKPRPKLKGVELEQMKDALMAIARKETGFSMWEMSLLTGYHIRTVERKFGRMNRYGEEHQRGA